MGKKKNQHKPSPPPPQIHNVVSSPTAFTEHIINTNFHPKAQKTKTSFYPVVSVCTPTFNRRPFINTMFECFKNQNYPKTCIEWIIVDDGTDPIEDLVISSGIENIRYYRIQQKMHLGEKRNFTHTKTTGSIIVYMDDDDYYPPERISHAVERLQNNKDALCAGSSEIYVFFKHINKMVQCGPYGPNHATAGTFAFRAELLKKTQYENTAALAEERAFLKDYTVPFVQLDPLKTILVFSHNHNTFDKKKLLENLNTQYCKESSITVKQFIRNPNEEGIYRFFMLDIDNLLLNYRAGEPALKPDVLEGIKRIEKEREIMIKQQQQQQQQQPQQETRLNITPDGKIFMENKGSPPTELNSEQIIGIISQQEQKIRFLTQQTIEKDQIIENLQKLLLRQKPVSLTTPIL